MLTLLVAFCCASASAAPCAGAPRERLASFALIVALAVVAAPARADDNFGGYPPRFGENPTRSYESSQCFAFELKFGPYSPNIDASPGLNGKHAVR